MRSFVVAGLVLLAATATSPASDLLRPEAHFAMPDPAALDAGTAEWLYRGVVDRLVKGYALSDEPAAKLYRGWWRANRAPYLSATHGARYVNNYLNARAMAYGTLAPGESMPVGSIVAKDAITVDRAGRVFPGPLSLMEKMAAGFAPAARDWRYVLIFPDGSVFADSAGSDPQGATFCVACHEQAGAAADHLFLIPDRHRRAPSASDRSSTPRPRRCARRDDAGPAAADRRPGRRARRGARR